MKAPACYLKQLAVPALALLAFSCAHIVTPAGGPKDVTPPKAAKCFPHNYSVQFHSDQVRITFDEFVKLTDPDNQIFISPTVEPAPEYQLRGKSLIVTFKSKLRDSTTYTMYLGNAVADITEGNILTGYRYVFSTGTRVDSMTLGGAVFNAFSGKPVKDMLVMLYEHNYDSVPYKEKPVYLSKSDEQGNYRLFNLKHGSYRLFALKDGNSNLIYDQPGEEIAFADSLVAAEPMMLPPTDTTMKDSLKKPVPLNPAHPLFSFLQVDSVQKLARVSLTNQVLLSVVFRFPAKSPEVRPLNFQRAGKWYVAEYSARKDTLRFWLTRTGMDTLRFVISDQGKVLDTSTVMISGKASSKNAGKGEGNRNTFTLTPSAGTTLDVFRPLGIVFSNPVAAADQSGVRLVEGNDTLKVSGTFSDSIQRHFRLNHKWKEATAYKLFIPPGSFTDIYGLKNDTCLFSFSTTSLKDYGTMVLNIGIRHPARQFLLQLLTDKDILVNEKVISTGGKIAFDHLKPGTYHLRAVVDDNANGVWDTGTYLKGIQPEKVLWFPGSLTVRANWDQEADWEW